MAEHRKTGERQGMIVDIPESHGGRNPLDLPKPPCWAASLASPRDRETIPGDL